MTTAFKHRAPAHQPEPEVIIHAQVAYSDGFLDEVYFFTADGDGKPGRIMVRFEDGADMLKFFDYLASMFGKAVKLALHVEEREHYDNEAVFQP